MFSSDCAEIFVIAKLTLPYYKRIIHKCKYLIFVKIIHLILLVVLNERVKVHCRKELHNRKISQKTHT